jgi:predicted ATPase
VQLVGRRTECCALEEVLAAVRAGESRALVVCGEAGIGKTALLDELIRRATGCRVIRISGLESEMELAFAALHQLCTPLLGQIDQIPAPQGEALLTAFGKRAGAAPDPFLLGLATLSLVAEAAADRPLLLLVDDEQWLDRSSARAIAFVARRIEAESVGVVFATRCVGKHLGGLRELPIRALHDKDSQTLLSAVVSGPLDIRVRDQIIAEARGNPLALLELPRTLTRAELAGGFGPPTRPVTRRCCGVRLKWWASPSTRRCRRSRPGSRRSGHGCGSGIPWFARARTGRCRCPTDAASTAHWPR